MDQLFYGFDTAVYTFIWQLQNSATIGMAEICQHMGDTTAYIIYFAVSLILCFPKRTRKYGVAMVIALLVAFLLVNADLILVHSKKQEEAFIADGFSYVIDGMETERLNWMYNYFVLCGPSADPAGVKDAADVKAAFKAIADGKFTFISRGDGSGTHTKEISLWPEDLGITAEAESFKDYTDWYVSANTGMGACLVMAEEMGAYILTDKATFLTFVANDGVMG